MLKDKIEVTMELEHQTQNLSFGNSREIGTIKYLKEFIGEEYFIDMAEVQGNEDKLQDFLDLLKENGNDALANDWVEKGLYVNDLTSYISLKTSDIEQTGYIEISYGWEVYYDINFQLNVKKLEKDYLAGKIKAYDENGEVIN